MALEDKTLLLNATYEFFKLRNPQIEVEVSSDKQYLLVPNNKIIQIFLQEIGFKNIENSQSQSKL